MPTDNKTPKNAKGNGEPTDADAGQDEVQENFDKADERGYFGEAVDPTPNEHYTLSGVVAGKPTPETDPALARKSEALLHAGEEEEEDKP